MSIYTSSKLLRRLSPNTIYLSSHLLSSVATPEQKPLPVDSFRTNQAVSRHTRAELGQFYTIDPAMRKQIFTHGGLPKKFEKQVKTFGETCLMVRPAAAELIHYIQHTNFNKPTTRYVIYGQDGVGKSLTLAHMLHYGAQNDFVLVHVPWVPNWFKKPKETANSTTQEGFIDLPLDAAAWLMHFRNQNAPLLERLKLTVSQDLVWSKREKTAAGASLSELIDHGINRVKFASDTIAALLQELKMQSTQGKCRTMVAIDGYNAFFTPHTRILTDNKQTVMPDKVSLTAPFVDISNFNWTNGVVLLVVDKMAVTEEQSASELPRYLLGKDGFEHVDPFVPIKVENYTEHEYQNCINYYVNRRWIQNTNEGFESELKFLSNCNPYKLMTMTASL
jgi:small subunit ribosomal protein S29